MPILQGLSYYFSKLEEIETADLQNWLPLKEDRTILENKIGNRMLYPRIIPETKEDLLFNCLMLKKVIALNKDIVYSKNLKRIDIPEFLLEFVPEIQNLIGIFIEAIRPEGITTLSLNSDHFERKNLGTLIRPENLQTGSFITIGIKDKHYQIKTGSLVVIPLLGLKTDVTFTSTEAKLLGKKIFSTQVNSGQLGLIIDTRI